ncbi:MAG: SUF system NifU family Fe-S cluster assembly protein, partial [Planctomycetes bacterium]|nr:SUF system NifU family Fe-S cluster assembly protein [Planctomycetota bacterium]
DVVEDVSFEGSGCAISTASASLMTESVKGKSLAEARAVFERFHEMVTSEESSGSPDSSLGKLQVFSGVVRYPARVKCATLAWHTFNAALASKIETVSTE